MFTISVALALIKSRTGMPIDVVPFAWVVDVTVIFPPHVPAPRPVVFTLTVSAAGVEVPDAVTWSQPGGHVVLGVTDGTTEVIGRAIPELVICTVCDGGAD